jgi:multiple sugar transport system substrate-binding protein
LNSYNTQFSTALKFLNDYWHLPEYPVLLDQLQEEISNAITGTKTVEEALNDAAKRHERTLQRAGYEIVRSDSIPDVPDQMITPVGQTEVISVN